MYANRSAWEATEVHSPKRTCWLRVCSLWMSQHDLTPAKVLGSVGGLLKDSLGPDDLRIKGKGSRDQSQAHRLLIK